MRINIPKLFGKLRQQKNQILNIRLASKLLFQCVSFKKCLVCEMNKKKCTTDENI